MSNTILAISTQRCGTTVFRTSFLENSDITDYCEVFLRPESIIDKLFNTAEFIENLKQGKPFDLIFRELNAIPADKKIYFDIKYSQLSQYLFYYNHFIGPIPEDFIQLFSEDHKTIHLTRSNKFNILVSRLVGRARKEWHHEAGQVPKKIDITVPISGLHNFIKQKQLEEYFFHGFFENKENTIHVPYESLFQDGGFSKDLSEAITNFLFHKSTHITPKMTKSQPYPLKDIIINYDEVEMELNNTEFKWMLEDQGNKSSLPFGSYSDLTIPDTISSVYAAHSQLTNDDWIAIGETGFFFEVCKLLIRLQKLDTAKAFLDKGIAMNPEVAVLYYHRARTFFGKKDMEAATRDIDKALSIEPQNELFLNLKNRLK
ncbi:hypothetical protein [Desulfovibrio inopinatus]|uniref:hypothetical protein n=1 Tax=Desulfovibrio inopinatus TaxID=102109 RepID=UPI0004159FF0|nr:hypothetical protein [Desulfovibrio inopinatus]